MKIKGKTVASVLNMTDAKKESCNSGNDMAVPCGTLLK